MFGIGLPEMIVILALALIVVGPDKLPELARSLAKGVNELKNTMNQVKESLTEETKVIGSVQDDLNKTAEQMQKNMLDDLGGPRKTTEAAELLDLDAATPRPWERDAAAVPDEEEASVITDEQELADKEEEGQSEPEDDFSDELATETSCNGTKRKNSPA
ncbi:MAG: twin-arginine translocase subunit TatB [Candidatus Electrothrix sp. AR3]|nr:twin-arginine translocase subunit TatB [Candidatus Electrothrix sp. AR3]